MRKKLIMFADIEVPHLSKISGLAQTVRNRMFRVFILSYINIFVNSKNKPNFTTKKGVI